MINTFLKYKMKHYKDKKFTINDIDKSQKILFSIFTRYGDTIINLIIIKEFILKYHTKKYLILCPEQMLPYVKKILPNIKVIGLNKRNIFKFLEVTKLLKKEKFDIGFNPWSNGLDSCYFISFCKKFLCYKKFTKPKIVNHYNIVRKYLKLPEKNWSIHNISLKKEYKHILICPESTDKYRSISKETTTKLIKQLKEKYNNAHFTIASIDMNYKIKEHSYFHLKKTKESSENFLNIIENVDLTVCVDSGPLHIMIGLNKDTIAIFNSTNKETVINTHSRIKVFQKNSMLKVDLW